MILMRASISFGSEVTFQRTKVEIKPGKKKKKEKKKGRTSENGVKNDFHEKLNRSHPQGELARFHLDRMDNPRIRAATAQES